MIILGYYYGVGGPSCSRIMANSKHAKYAMSWGRKERTSIYDPEHRQARKSGRVFVRTIVRWNNEPVLFFRHGYSGTQLENDWIDMVSPIAMRRAQNKYQCRKRLYMLDISVPITWGGHRMEPPVLPCVSRPMNHSQGKDFRIHRTSEDYYYRFRNGYCSALIDKVAEYRVYIYGGYAYAVSKKIPELGVTSDQPWNHAQGNAHFKVLRNKMWPKNAVNEALKAAYSLDLFYCAVDVLTEKETLKPYICEINTAGSLKGGIKPSHIGYLLDRTYEEYIAGNHSVLNITSPDDRKAMRHPWLKEKDTWYEVRNS